MEIKNIHIFGVMVAVVLCTAGLLSVQVNIHNDLDYLANDLNILKSNDLTMAQYIQYNSQTLEYLNKNCKITNDTNEVTVLTCIKVKE